MKRLSLRIPADLAKRLNRAAKRLHCTRSELVRLALEQFLNQTPSSSLRPIDRVRDLLGQIDSGIPDLGSRHRDYLMKRLRQDHDR